MFGGEALGLPRGASWRVGIHDGPGSSAGEEGASVGVVRVWGEPGFGLFDVPGVVGQPKAGAPPPVAQQLFSLFSWAPRVNTYG